MAKKITITFTAPVAPAAQPINEICRMFLPNNAAADNAAFDGTYYDTNVAGMAGGITVEQFIAGSVAHPGLIAMLKQAMASSTGKYEAVTEDEKLILYLGEVAPAIADQGFVIVIADANADAE